MPPISSLLLAPWALMILVSTLSAWRYGWGLPRPEIPGRLARAAIIVAVKGCSPTTRACFERLAGQAYADFRIIAAVETAEDPAAALIASLARDAPGKMTLVVAGEVTRGGQKVANLLAALDAIETRDEIIVFTDADTLPDPLWLSRLVSALVDAGHGAVTGYRWMVPVNARLSSAFVAAANTSIVTLPRVPDVTNLCWGGTMAMRRETLDTINIRKYWTGAISDDLQMTRALHDHGVKIFSPRQSLLLSPVDFDWQSAFAFGVRQYRLVYLHFPELWCLALLCLLVPVLSCVLAIHLAIEGMPAAWLALAFALGCGEIRFRCRRRIAASLWGLEQAGFEKLPARVDRWLRPLWFGFHAMCVLAAPLSRKLSWAGIDYLMRAPQDVRVLRRAPRAGKRVEATPAHVSAKVTSE